jgi:hypothetical protein
MRSPETIMTSVLDPFAAIEKRPLLTEDGMKSRGFTVRIEDESASIGWREVGVVSEDYLLVPNRDVRAMAHEITDKTGLEWDVSKTFFDGKRFVYALATTSDRLAAEVVPGDVLSLGLMFENSYDGSRRLAANLFANRLACSNGMLVPQFFARLRFKHGASSAGWESETRDALSMIVRAGGDLKRFADTARQLTSMPFETTEMERIRGGGLSRLPVSLWGKIIDRYLMHEERSTWGFLNAGTNVVWHNERGSVQDFNHNAAINAAVLEFYETRGDLMN